jgi:acyl-CoA synthetase (AMP-forming)/AMP-acid ligase II
MTTTQTPSDEDLIAQGMTVAVHARRQPDRLAIISPSGNRTWREFNARANQIVRVFRERGLQPGDGVALLAHNGPEFAEVWAATQRAGLLLTAVNWHQSPEIIGPVRCRREAGAPTL